MAILTVLIGGADEGAMAFLGSLRWDVAKRARRAARLWARPVAGAALDALCSVALPLSADEAARA